MTAYKSTSEMYTDGTEDRDGARWKRSMMGMGSGIGRVRGVVGMDEGGVRRERAMAG